MDDYSLADLVKITGAKRRSVQLWAEAGVIRAYAATERRGTGTHRQFGRDEVIIACVVHAFACRQMTVGELLEISSATREFLNRGKDRDVMEILLAGKGGEWAFVWQAGRRRPQIEAEGFDRETLKNAEMAVILPLDRWLGRFRRSYARG